MHAKLNIHFVFDDSNIPGDTLEEKEAYIQRRLTSIAEMAADTGEGFFGSRWSARGDVVHGGVYEVTHEISLN